MGGKTKKFELKKTLKNLTKVKSWQLILILIPLLFIAATLLRFDHIKMVELKNAVVAADEEGDSEKIKTSLNELKDFTEKHIIVNIVEKNGVYEMFFGTGEIYLQNEYKRTATALKIQAEQEAGVYANPNGNIYEKAMAVCQPLAHQYGWTWDHPDHIQCYQDELAKYPTEDTLETSSTVELPNPALYRYDFVSPIWNFSWSGVVILVAAIITIVIVVRFFMWLILRIAIAVVK